MNYQDAWQFLDELQFFKIKLGLDSMTGFLESLGQPQKHTPFIHIAGTNGKGSTAVTLLTLLVDAGYRIGMYTSPHLNVVRERFRINGQFISEDEFGRHASRIKAVLNGRQITYFEFTTTMAFLWFAEQEVDLAILEVGMGGRLDATNVITPLLSIITNVSMDHEAYLGDTLAEVAREKAGIIKRGVPVISGVGLDDSRDIVVQRAAKQEAPLYLLGRDFSWSQEADEESWSYHGINNLQYHRLVSGLHGRHQKDNAALALAVLELLPQRSELKCELAEEQVGASLQQTKWPGRLELISIDRQTGRSVTASCAKTANSSAEKVDIERFILDGAHNPAGVESLKIALEDEMIYGSLIGVWASMADKDIANSFLAIAPLFSKIIITRPESDRSAEPETIKALLPEEIKLKVSCHNSVDAALKQARKIAKGDDLICVAGSLYLIGAIREILLGGVVI